MLAALLLGFPLVSQAATPVFKGENCVRCHASIRDKTPGPASNAAAPADGGSFDAIVVGGGVSGLSAAHFLKDRPVLVLEAENKPGGRARRESFGPNRRYPTGAVYTSEPVGAVKKLYDGLGLKAQLITMPAHTLAHEGGFIPDWLAADGSRLPAPEFSDQDRAGFKRLIAEMKDLTRTSSLMIPIEDAPAGVLEKYDSVSFWDYLEKNYGRRLAEIGDIYARDVFGDGAREVSAYAGLLYLASEEEESKTWEGGMGEIPEAIHKELGSKVRTGALVWKVAQDASGVDVYYTRSGKDYRARGKTAVVALPAMIARRIVSGLPADKIKAMSEVRYSSYALVPLKLKKVVWADSFVLWMRNAFVTDFTLPRAGNAALKKNPSAGQVLVGYAPMGGLAGRKTLLTAPDQELVSKTLADLERALPGASGEVEEARVIRWGHAMPLAYPGYLSKVRPLLARPEGRIFFAGTDTQLPAMEGAIYSGYFAAEKAGALLK